MAVKIPLKALCNGSGDTCALSEFQAADFLGVDNGGTGLITQGICEYTRPGCFDSSCGTTFLGVGAGKATLEAKYNTMIGYCAGAGITTSCDVTLLGHKAGMAITTAALGATLVGQSAGVALTTGTAATYIGYEAGAANSTGILNTFLGYQAGNLATASCNTAVGSSTLVSLTTGIDNTTVGTNTGKLLVSTNNNTFIGSNAGCVATCANNTMVGAFAGRSQTTGCQNTFIGVCAGHDSQGAQGNVVVGFVAGQKLTGGTNNVFIGQGAGQCTNNGSNNIYIGEAAGCTQTTKSSFFEVRNAGLTLMNGCFTTGNLSIPNGNVGIGTTVPKDTLHVRLGTNLNWQFGYPSNSVTTLAALNDAESAYVTARIDAGTLELNGQSGGDVNLGAGVLVVDTSEARVGIGTATPAYQLDLDGGTTVNERLSLNRGSDDTGQFMTLGWDNISVHRNTVIANTQTSMSFKQVGSDGSRTAMIIDGAGEVGIGTTAPTVPFQVSPTAHAAGVPAVWLHSADNAADHDGVVISAVNNGADAEVLHVRTNNTTYANGTSLMLVRGDGDFSVDGCTLYVDADVDRVGIGTTTPSHKFNVFGSLNNGIKVVANTDTDFAPDSGFANDALVLQNSTAGDNNPVSMYFATGSNGEVRLSAIDDASNGDANFALTMRRAGGNRCYVQFWEAGTGFVGIRTDRPQKALSVVGDAAFDGPTQTISSAGAGRVGATINLDSNYSFENGYTADSTISGSDYLGAVLFNTADTSGNGAGVGAAIRSQVIDPYGRYSLDFHTTGTDATEGDDTLRMRITNQGDIQFIGSAGNLYWEKSTSNLGIGTNAPSSNAAIHAVTTGYSGASGAIILEDTRTDANPFIQIKNDARQYNLQVTGVRSDNFEIYDNGAGAIRLAVTSGGNVGIGTSSPANARTVITTAGVNGANEVALGLGHGDASLTAGQQVALNFNQGGDANVALAQIAGEYSGGSFNGDLVFKMNVGTSGNLTERARILSSGGITFNGDTAAANALDDYEEGTWTPTFTPSTSGSITLAAGGGAYYTKIGQLVTATLSVTVASVSSPIGYVSVNLPFAPNTSNQKGRSAVAVYVDGLAAGHNTRDAIALTEDSSASLRIYQGDSNSNQADFAQAVGAGTYFNLTVSYIV